MLDNGHRQCSWCPRWEGAHEQKRGDRHSGLCMHAHEETRLQHLGTPSLSAKPTPICSLLYSIPQEAWLWQAVLPLLADIVSEPFPQKR